MTETLARMRSIVGTSSGWGATSLVLGDGEIALERHGDGSVSARIGNGVDTFVDSPAFQVFPRKREVTFQVSGDPLDVSEILGVVSPPLGETWLYDTDFVGSSGLWFFGGISPASDYTITAEKNGTPVGTILLSSAGDLSFHAAFPFALIGGTDTLVLKGSAIPSAAVNYVITLYAEWR